MMAEQRWQVAEATAENLHLKPQTRNRGNKLEIAYSIWNLKTNPQSYTSSTKAIPPKTFPIDTNWDQVIKHPKMLKAFHPTHHTYTLFLSKILEGGAWKVVSVIKFLLHKLGDLSLDPQHPHKKPSVVTCFCNLGAEGASTGESSSSLTR